MSAQPRESYRDLIVKASAGMAYVGGGSARHAFEHRLDGRVMTFCGRPVTLGMGWGHFDHDVLPTCEACLRSIESRTRLIHEDYELVRDA